MILPFVGYHKVEFKKLKKYFFLKEFNNKKFYFVQLLSCNSWKKSSILSTTKQQGITYCSSIIGDRYLGTQFHSWEKWWIRSWIFKKGNKNYMKSNFSLYGLPKDVKFCKKCVISNQRPNSVIEFKNKNNKKRE